MEPRGICLKRLFYCMVELGCLSKSTKGNRYLMSEQIVHKTLAAVFAVLERVPFVQQITTDFSNYVVPPNAAGIDAIVELRYGKKLRRLLIDAKRNIQLRDARISIEFLRRSLEKYEDGYGILASDHLPESVRELCQTNDIGYIDFSGNCRLAFDNVFIEREVLLRSSTKKRLKSIFSLKSSRVVRRLLEEPARHWKVQTLAQDANVSLATVSLVKERLFRQEYSREDAEGFRLTKPEALLLDWAAEYSPSSISAEYYANEEGLLLESNLATQCQTELIGYAFTMFSGARRIASFTRGVQRVHVYVASRDELVVLQERLQLKPVDSGGNLKVLLPADEDVFFGRQNIDGYWIVSDVQLFLDLYTNKGRGQENAEFLLEKRLRPKWR